MNERCPSCNKTVESLAGSALIARFSAEGKSYNTVVYSCPLCNSILGCQMDSSSLRAIVGPPQQTLT